MNLLPSPFKLTEYENNVVQTRGFIFSKNPLRDENLENMISRFNGNSTDEVNRRGIIAELLAVDLISTHLDAYFANENPFFEGGIIKGREGFLINSKGKYSAKLISENRIVILKKDKRSIEENKFGFLNIAEIDGLYMLKRVTHEDKTKRKEKKLIVVETKSSDARINPIHIAEDIILPLQKMYDMPISYLLVGFKEDIYADEEYNKLNNGLKETYYNLKELGIEFCAVHFPFKKEEFSSFASRLESERTGIYTGKARYNTNNSYLELMLPDGKIIRGSFKQNQVE